MQTHWELGLKLKHIILVRLGKGALVAVTLALWCEEGLEAVTSLRGISPRLDVVMDLLTGISTVAVIAWICTEAIVAASARQAKALAAVIDATDTRAGRAGNGRALHAVGSRKA